MLTYSSIHTSMLKVLHHISYDHNVGSETEVHFVWSLGPISKVSYVYTNSPDILKSEKITCQISNTQPVLYLRTQQGTCRDI